jgi:hypothetical protein
MYGRESKDAMKKKRVLESNLDGSGLPKISLL